MQISSFEIKINRINWNKAKHDKIEKLIIGYVVIVYPPPFFLIISNTLIKTPLTNL